MSDQIFSELGQEFSKTYRATKSQMFGKPCLKTGKKAFVAFYKGEMVFKLGAKDVNLLLDKYYGSARWDPSGKERHMKDWLQVPDIFKDDWPALAKQAMLYVEANK